MSPRLVPIQPCNVESKFKYGSLILYILEMVSLVAATQFGFQKSLHFSLLVLCLNSACYTLVSKFRKVSVNESRHDVEKHEGGNRHQIEHIFVSFEWDEHEPIWWPIASGKCSVRFFRIHWVVRGHCDLVKRNESGVDDIAVNAMCVERECVLCPIELQGTPVESSVEASVVVILSFEEVVEEEFAVSEHSVACVCEAARRELVDWVSCARASFRDFQHFRVVNVTRE